VKYLLDSVIVIDHLNGVPAAAEFLAEHGKQCVMSAITRAEVLVGADERTEYAVVALLNQFPTLPITVEVADLGASLRRQHHWKLPDALQAAAAILAKVSLVTRDARAFKGADGLDVLRPYRIAG
jgi:predicted nucleic acid-binding protein